MYYDDQDRPMMEIDEVDTELLNLISISLFRKITMYENVSEKSPLSRVTKILNYITAVFMIISATIRFIQLELVSQAF